MVECATIFLYFNYKSIMQNVTVQTGRCYLNLTEVGRTRPERTMSGVVGGGWLSLPSQVEGCREGESGRKELLRGPFALFGARSSAKLVRDLAKHRRTPMSPPQLIPPTSPGQVFAGDERLIYTLHHPVRWPAAASSPVQNKNRAD